MSSPKGAAFGHYTPPLSLPDSRVCKVALRRKTGRPYQHQPQRCRSAPSCSSSSCPLAPDSWTSCCGLCFPGLEGAQEVSSAVGSALSESVVSSQHGSVLMTGHTVTALKRHEDEGDKEAAAWSWGQSTHLKWSPYNKSFLHSSLECADADGSSLLEALQHQLFFQP